MHDIPCPLLPQFARLFLDLPRGEDGRASSSFTTTTAAVAFDEGRILEKGGLEGVE